LNSVREGSPQISLDDIVAWEAHHGMIPQGAVVAVRRAGARDDLSTTDLSSTPLPIARDAAMFLIEARYTIAFAVETPVNLTSDRTLARQLALHGDYVVEGTTRFTSLPATGSLIIVAPAKNKKPGEAPVRILAMVR
jgi:kynurenine formamidase